MLTKYLYIYFSVLFLSQPEFIKMLYSSILGRIILLLSVMIVTYKIPILGFVYAFVLMVILKINDDTEMEGFNGSGIVPAVYEDRDGSEPDISIDREKMEKKMITPVSSKTSLPFITPILYDYDYEFDSMEPTANEPVTMESFLGYSYINNNNDVMTNELLQ
jgi:hypothetical protein